MARLTACTLDCGDACSLVVDETADGGISIKGNPDHPFTRGFCCVKGTRYYKRFIDRPDRITRPLLKSGNGFEPISMNRALDICTQKIANLQDRPETILHIHGHAARGALWQAGTYLFRKLGASGIYGSLCDQAGIEACLRDFGAMHTNDPMDLEQNTRLLVNWGRDIERTSVHLAAMLKKARKNGLKVITITPGGDSNADYSDTVIRVRPGRDRFLAAAVLRLLMDRGLIDESVFKRTSNGDVFRTIIAGLDVDELLRESDVSATDVNLLADWYGGSTPVASIMGWGISRYLHGGENVRFVNALALLSGNIGIIGGGAYFGISSSRNFVPYAPETEYSRTLRVPDIGREILEADPKIEMAWINGFNIAVQAPDCREVIRAIQGIDFVVAVEAFRTDTAMLADLVLPAALMMEREEILGSAFHNYIVHSAKRFDPPGEAMSDFDYMTRLGKRLSPPIEMPVAEECLASALKSPTLSVDLASLKQKGWADSIHPNPAYKGLVFGHEDGKYRFPESLSREKRTDPEYPLHLLSLIEKAYTHSQIPEEDQQGLPKAWISPNNIMLDRLNVNRPVFIVTPKGRLEVELGRLEDLHPEVVMIRRGGWMKHGRSINPILEAYITDMGDNAAQYSQMARFENG